MPDWMNTEHDNGEGKSEVKYTHPDGREAVYDGDNGELITDPSLKGTYNYVNPAKPSWNPLSWPKAAVKGAGHFTVDMVPYYIGGNVRGPD